jgi:hypothetical protein
VGIINAEIETAAKAPLNTVIPAKAGIHWLLTRIEEAKWIPAYAGMTISGRYRIPLSREG